GKNDGALDDLLAGRSVGRNVLNTRGFIAVNFRATDGHAINAATINGDEIELRDAQNNLITLRGPPERVTGTDTYKYAFNGPLAAGTYKVTIKGGSFADDTGVVNLEEVESFRVETPTATLVDPVTGAVIDREVLNNRHYILVKFTPTTGAELDRSSIDGG